MLILFSAFCITFTALVKATLVMVGAGFALFLFIVTIFAVLVLMTAAMISDVRVSS